MGEVASRQTGFKTPSGGDRREWLEHESALLQRSVRDRQRPRPPLATAPCDDVEVENARPPASSAAPAEIPLDLLQAFEHFGRRNIALHQRDAIGEVAAGAAVGRVEKNRRGVEQSELLVEPGDCSLDDACGPSVAAVRAVGADGDGVEMLSQTGNRSP